MPPGPTIPFHMATSFCPPCNHLLAPSSEQGESEEFFATFLHNPLRPTSPFGYIPFQTGTLRKPSVAVPASFAGSFSAFPACWANPAACRVPPQCEGSLPLLILVLSRLDNMARPHTCPGMAPGSIAIERMGRGLHNSTLTSEHRIGADFTRGWVGCRPEVPGERGGVEASGQRH
jgi:hypothetical protein